MDVNLPASAELHEYFLTQDRRTSYILSSGSVDIIYFEPRIGGHHIFWDQDLRISYIFFSSGLSDTINFGSEFADIIYFTSESADIIYFELRIDGHHIFWAQDYRTPYIWSSGLSDNIYLEFKIRGHHIFWLQNRRTSYILTSESADIIYFMKFNWEKNVFLRHTYKWQNWSKPEELLCFHKSM